MSNPASAQPASLLTAPEGEAAPPTTDSTAATDTPAAKAPEGAIPAANAEAPAPAAGEAKPDGEAKADAPLELKLPDGFAVDDAVLGEFKALATEAKLAPEQAQKLVDFHVRAQESVYAKAQESFDAQAKAWQAETKADKEIGGREFEGTLKHARLALSRFGTPELTQALEQSGLGNHPEVVRLLARVAKATAEDSSAGKHSTAQATPATSEDAFLRSMYPHLFKD